MMQSMRRSCALRSRFLFRTTTVARSYGAGWVVPETTKTTATTTRSSHVSLECSELLNFRQQRLQLRRSFAADATATDSSNTNSHDNDTDETTLEKATSGNLFRVLGLQPSFAIDLNQLKQVYRKLMSEYHPDKQQQQQPLSSSDNMNQGENDDRASLITLAYDTLKDPHTRASHLLQVLGHPMGETDNTLVCKAFLMHIMEVREEVDEATDDETLQCLLEQNDQRAEKTCHELSDALDKQDPPQIERARQLTAQLQYWNRIHESIREKMDQ